MDGLEFKCLFHGIIVSEDEYEIEFTEVLPSHHGPEEVEFHLPILHKTDNNTVIIMKSSSYDILHCVCELC